ncbi:MAG: hypothetical protein IAF38_13270 [Bacteroidia bacterium]|nr:hypothetical protein [Bacteroidia bacterium]
MTNIKNYTLSFIIALFSLSALAQNKNEAEIKIEPSQDALYSLEHNLMIVMRPAPEKMKKAIIEVNGPALVSEVQEKPGYYDVFPTANGEIDITIRLKGKVLYHKKIKAINEPTDPVQKANYKMKMAEVQKILKTN